jgi:hypothetical protein
MTGNGWMKFLAAIVHIICFKIKNPPPVELCWQKKEIPRISLNPTSRQNLTFGLSQISNHKNGSKNEEFLTAKLKRALITCFEEFKKHNELGPKQLSTVSFHNPVYF